MALLAHGRVQFRRLMDRAFNRCVVCRCVPAPAAPVPGVRALDLCGHCLSHFPGICEPIANWQGARLCVGCGQLHRVPLQQVPLQPEPQQPEPQQPEPLQFEPLQQCPACDHREPLFRRIVVPYRYAWPVEQLLHDLKYRERRCHAPVFGTLLGRQAMQTQAVLPDLLLPVPLHQSRYLSRGFNHAADIARWCARVTGVPSAPGLARRVLDTGAMAGLTRAERQARIRGAFIVDAALADRRVAIVDDVLTSGATAGELARELYDTGVEEVELWAVARTAVEPEACDEAAPSSGFVANSRRCNAGGRRAVS